jgi:transcriptional regulator GlxA family with amidase domain
MGSTAAMESINRVLTKHGMALERELREQYPSALIRLFSLENGIHHVAVEAELVDGTVLTLEPYDIDELAERFPDCEIGY